MTLNDIVSLITDQAGALVVLALAVYGLVRGLVVPKPVYDAEIKRNELLEKENAALNAAVGELRDQAGNLNAQIARLQEKVENLESEIRRLALDA